QRDEGLRLETLQSRERHRAALVEASVEDRTGREPEHDTGDVHRRVTWPRDHVDLVADVLAQRAQRPAPEHDLVRRAHEPSLEDHRTDGALALLATNQTHAVAVDGR